MTWFLRFGGWDSNLRPSAPKAQVKIRQKLRLNAIKGL
jgi:hypothetical protein